MEEPILQLNTEQVKMPHHQGYEVLPIAQENQATTVGGTILTDRSFSKFGVSFGYTMVHKTKYLEIQKIIDKAYNTNKPLYFRYVKIDQYKIFKRVMAKILGVKFVTGTGADTFYYSFNLDLIDVDPR